MYKDSFHFLNLRKTVCALCVALSGALSGSVSYAQELLSISVSPQQVEVGQLVNIELGFKPYGNNAICGLLINFGDGTSDYLRVDEKNLPVRITRQYNAPGSMAIQADGKTRFQGINTLISCQGSAKTAAVTVVPEDYAARRAAEIAAGKAALGRAEADRRAADAAARNASAQRQAAEQSNRRANADKAAADQLASKSAVERLAAKRQAELDARPSAAPATRPTEAPPQAAPAAPKPPPGKPKSALDL